MAARLERHDAQRPREPRRLDGQNLPGGAGGKLVMPAEIEGRRLVALDPKPKHFVVAAQVHFRSGQRRVGTQAETPIALECHERPQGRRSAGDRHAGLAGVERLDLPTVAVDHIHHLLERRLGRERAGQRLRILLQHVGATGTARSDQQHGGRQQGERFARQRTHLRRIEEIYQSALRQQHQPEAQARGVRPCSLAARRVSDASAS